MAQIKTSINRAPKAAKILELLIHLIDRMFNWAYSSKYNPLYKSGTFAASMMFLLIISGLFLIFFYRISAPFESIVNIQNKIILGKFVRSFHRYVSDVTIIALFFHILRMIVEGKTWGPRFLAWTSGVVLLFMFLLSGWTGYVMVWDRHGQMLAIAGAKMVDSLGLFTEPLMRTFTGAYPVQSSFFFMNLFLHVAIPLGMIGGLWLHTSKLARSVWWFESKRTAQVTIGILIIWALIVSAPIASPPDLLKNYGIEPTDLFFNFWLPLISSNNAKIFLIIFLLVLIFLFSMTFWWRPLGFAKIEKSKHDQLRCEGCRQCEEDCPFDAISMVQRTAGTGSEFVASVNENLCVSCGLCSGSCSQLAIGPPSRSGRVQLEVVKELRNKHGSDRSGIVIIFCDENIKATPVIKWMDSKNYQFDYLNVSCVGSIHPAVIQTLLHSYKGVYIVGCPQGLCVNREGFSLAVNRILYGRNPAHIDKLPKDKIKIVSYANDELSHLLMDITMFYEDNQSENYKSTTQKQEIKKFTLIEWMKMTSFTSLILSAVTIGSGANLGIEPEKGSIALSWKMPRQSIKNCKKLSDKELANLPFHMRTQETCTEKQVPYELKLKINGSEKISKIVTSHGARSDRPIYVNEVIESDEGYSDIEISFKPFQEDSFVKDLIHLDKKINVNIKKGYSTLVTWSEQGGIEIKNN